MSLVARKTIQHIGIPAQLEDEKEEFLNVQWRSIDTIKTGLESAIQATMENMFDDQLEEIIKALRGTKRQIETSLTVELLLNISFWIEETWNRLRPGALDAIFAGFETGAIKAGIAGVDFTSGDPAVLETLRSLNEKSRIITETTAERLGDVVQDGLTSGADIDTIASNIQGLFDDMKLARARAIAITNVTTGFESGQQESFKRGGIGFKRWLSQRDGKVRPAHDEVDGQEVPVAESFTVAGVEMMHPGDPSAPAALVINCRCTMLPVTAPGRSFEVQGRAFAGAVVRNAIVDVFKEITTKLERNMQNGHKKETNRIRDNGNNTG